MRFFIACSSLSGYDQIVKVIPPAVLQLIEIGVFTPTQRMLDQGTVCLHA